MKSLADIRRRMQPGTRLVVVKQTKFPEQLGSTRVVAKSMTKQIKWEPTELNEWYSFSDWPKAKEIRILDEDTYEYDLIDERDGSVFNTVGLRFLPADEKSEVPQ